MPVVVDKGGNVVSRSRNLAGIRKYAQAHLANRVVLSPLEGGGGNLHVAFDNGSTCDTDFNSFEVMKNFVDRWRSVKSAASVEVGPAQARKADVRYEREGTFGPTLPPGTYRARQP